MAIAPCIPVPSPREINKRLFPEGTLEVTSLSPIWRASVLLTPFGGINDTPSGFSSDQLAVANVTYDASRLTEQFMRVGVYLLENLYYYDFLFKSSSGQTQWWSLVSDPNKPNSLPTASFGPFNTAAIVPSLDFFIDNAFSHAGTWKVHGISRNAFSSRKRAEAGTWYWFDPGSGVPARIMNVDQRNDFQIAMLGAYYFVDFMHVDRMSSSNLEEAYRRCSKKTTVQPPSSMVKLDDILATMTAPPAGSQIQCTPKQIQSLIPGISRGAEIMPPSWTNRVNSECYMIGQDIKPYYSQVWYDSDYGCQVTVFVQHNNRGSYTKRVDFMLPSGTVGPAIVYRWKHSKWHPVCCVAEGGLQPMPVRNFVARDHGKCRAVIKDNPQLKSMSIWSVALGGSSNFWYWFNDRRQGTIFSLAPAPKLTLIDYQTFIQNGTIDACIFNDPCSDLPACPPKAGRSLQATRWM
jgi:hypothetical protein